MNMDREFYIFRHGETDWNKQKRCQGHTDIDLNQTGLNQAKELGKKLLNIELEIIYSSDLKRAKATGSVVAEMKQIPITFDSRLREMSYGRAEGMLFQSAIEHFGEELWQGLQSFKKENDHIGFPEGESRKVARERFLRVLDEIIENTNYTKIGISTHGGSLRNVLHSFLPEEISMIPIPNCVVYRLIYKANQKQFIAEDSPFL